MEDIFKIIFNLIKHRLTAKSVLDQVIPSQNIIEYFLLIYFNLQKLEPFGVKKSLVKDLEPSWSEQYQILKQGFIYSCFILELALLHIILTP